MQIHSGVLLSHVLCRRVSFGGSYSDIWGCLMMIPLVALSFGLFILMLDPCEVALNQSKQLGWLPQGLKLTLWTRLSPSDVITPRWELWKSLSFC
eukprot:NODE_8198_length_529_cov_1.697917_g7143_i0.p2 GENE.NODE_8198_length_529_cov_1.697917_g7143_i0~~NODE_8198_length_529_cov_1.697917_g7143_i0.p2  ORF type:complete len:95 (-),score=1.05 NODE_8198_length_529_cov_1.697917_g7143_i0:54-338(-)